VKHGGAMCFGILFVAALGVFGGPAPASAQSKQQALASGVLSGVVHDNSGVPQLGATVEVSSETPGVLNAHQFLTNTQGMFRGDKLPPGLYTVQVTLAGFLPTIERHVRISSNLTTVVRIQMESMFAAIEQLRRPPTSGAAEPDDWKWVLRSGSGLRPVLQWHEDESDTTSSLVIDTPNPRPLGRLELTDGARRPGSVSNVGSAPATAFAYDLRIDRSNHLVFAGQMSYDQDSPAGGLAAIWLPTGSLEAGPKSTIALREAKIGPEGAIFRGARVDQSGTITLGDRALIRVGGEFVVVGAGSSAWSVRPRVKWESKIGQNWYLDAIYASLPMGAAMDDVLINDKESVFSTSSVLTQALDQLDDFPTMLWHAGKPVLENGRHEEIAVERKLNSRSIIQLAGFHDDNTHVALFGRGNGLPVTEFFPDLYSKGFAYDGGASNDWGARAALREKINDDLEFAAIYAFSGALIPTTNLTDSALRDALQTMGRQSLAAKFTARVPKVGTRVTAGYKWVNGSTLSRVDPYGEGVYGVNPFLHVGIRQQLPKFALGRWEASAECDNLLAQGYVPMTTRDGQVYLVPSFRSFRGGLSLQF
jgi:Carboxypeptidase regulatory-like domain